MINPARSEHKMTTAWQFPDAPDTACYATTDVLNGCEVKKGLVALIATHAISVFD